MLGGLGKHPPLGKAMLLLNLSEDDGYYLVTGSMTGSRRSDEAV